MVVELHRTKEYALLRQMRELTKTTDVDLGSPVMSDGGNGGWCGRFEEYSFLRSERVRDRINKL